MISVKQIESTRNASLVRTFQQAYHHQLYLYAVGLCKKYREDPSLAKDLLQNMYCKIMISPDLIMKGYQKRKLPYLMKMIKYDLINIVERQKGWQRQEIIYCMRYPDVTHIEDAMKTYLKIELEEILANNLKADEHEIMAHYMKGYTMKEIAEMVKMNPSTVGVKIYRAKEKLRQFF